MADPITRYKPISEVTVGARVLVATVDGMTHGVIVGGDMGVEICGCENVFMVGVECGSGLLWRERSEVYTVPGAEVSHG